MTRPTFTPGRRVVLRAGALFARDQRNQRVQNGGLSVTVTRAHQSYLPHAAYEWEGLDAHGRPILFMATDAELVGNLP
jgi:hypothetical protein